jgi:hypothetical protein
MIEQREVDVKCKCKGVSKKGQQCLKKAFDVVPQRWEVELKVLSEDLKIC